MKLLFSLGTQSLLVLLALWVAQLRPQSLEYASQNYHFMRLVETPPPINHIRPPIPLPAPARAPLLTRPSPEAIRVSADTKHLPHEAAQPAPVNIRLPSKPILEVVAPLMPRLAVKTHVFSASSSVPAPIERNPQKVQTGGFGDPNGVPAHQADNKPVNIARLGSFDLPSDSGHGNGAGETHGTRAVIASAGFGNGAAAGSPTGQPRSTAIEPAGFGRSEPATATQGREHQGAAVGRPTMVPAEILFKPAPAYTEEARKLRIEGEVLVEVVFQASGAIRVTRVVRGLGHGLDQSAIQAAEQIRFKPALRDGQSADSTAVLHILFHLA